MRLVKVEWVDSYGVGSTWEAWHEVKDVAHTCISVGYLALDGENVKVIVPHVSPENDVIGAEQTGCGDMSIPCCSIVSMVDLVSDLVSKE